MLKIILNRLKPHAEKIIAEEQAGFRSGRRTTEQIFNLRNLCEKYPQNQQDLYRVFTEFREAFDRASHAALWATKKKYNITSMKRPPSSPLKWQHKRLVPNNSWSPTGMSTLTHPFQRISGKDHERCLRRS